MVNNSMAVIYEDSNFDELAERVLLKALLVWVKLRFVAPLKLKYPEFDQDIPKLVSAVANNKAVAVVSDTDIWTVQKNAALFSTVARAFAKKFMTDELYQGYGAISFEADRKRHDAAIVMTPAQYQPSFNEIIPCIMHVKAHDQILRDYKDHGYTHQHQVDIIPMLKAKRNVYLTPEENAVIDKAYKDFKSDPDFVQKRKDIETERMLEDKQLKAVLKAMSRQGDSSDIKLAVAMHTIVDTSYQHDAHRVMKVTIDGKDATPVKEFSRLFIINYDADLEYIKLLLENMIDPNIKIKVGKGRILFTTKSGADPNAEGLHNDISTMVINDRESLDHHFDLHVGHITDIADVERIMQRVIQHKYKNYY